MGPREILCTSETPPPGLPPAGESMLDGADPFRPDQLPLAFLLLQDAAQRKTLNKNWKSFASKYRTKPVTPKVCRNGTSTGYYRMRWHTGDVQVDLLLDAISR